MAAGNASALASKWQVVCTAGQDIELPASGKSNFKGLKGYYYDEMIKRLNTADKGQIGSAGYFLRRLWKRHESGFTLHEADAYSGWHEQSQKANRAEFERKHKKMEIGFRKAGGGVWGVCSDLVFDTCQKDWTKAYQLTFHEFFHVIDMIARDEGMISSSMTYYNSNFQFDTPLGAAPYVFDPSKRPQFGEVIIKDVQNITAGDLAAIQSLPKHDKAPLYDAIGGVRYKDKYPDKILDKTLFTKSKDEEMDYEQYGHYPISWLKDGFMDEDMTKERALSFFDELVPIAIRYRNIDVNSSRDIVEKNFLVSATSDKNKALSVLAAVAAHAIKAPGADAVIARASATVAGILERVQKHFPARLAMEVFANMAATAITNIKAYEAMRKYLPNSHKMFKKILEAMFHCGL